MELFQPMLQVVASAIIYNSPLEIPNMRLTGGNVTVATYNK
jgi:hypothetical protein